MPQSKLTKRSGDAFRPAAKRYTVWDIDVSGFGLRVTPAGQQVYVVKYRTGGQQRRSAWVAVDARDGPQRSATPSRGITQGIDPSEKRKTDRRAFSFRELCDLHLAEGAAHKKPAMIKSDVGRITHHLLGLPA